jgi:hypothetical protein
MIYKFEFLDKLLRNITVFVSTDAKRDLEENLRSVSIYRFHQTPKMAEPHSGLTVQCEVGLGAMLQNENKH